MTQIVEVIVTSLISLLLAIIAICTLSALQILFVILNGILFGSKVDPDDNGLLRTKAQREAFRQKKLRNMEKYK